MKANNWICLLSALLLCISASSCKKKPSADDQPSSSNIIQQEKPEVISEKPVVEEKSMDNIEEPSKPLDLSLDKKTIEVIRDASTDIEEAPEQLPNLFKKEENRVKLNSRVLIDEETEELSEAAGAELNLELKVK